MFRARPLLACALAALVLLAALSTTAQASATASLKLAGAVKNTVGQQFKWQISGFAGHKGNRVVVFEQYYKRSGCASTYKGEVARETQTAQYSVTVFLNSDIGAHSDYNLEAQFYAANAGAHGICAYLINAGTLDTYAHAGGWWQNVAATGSSTTGTNRLQPAPLGSAACEASRFSDGDVVAQIAILGATCVQAASVDKNADSAHGGSYTADGFSCSATAERAGSTWSTAWSGTYYAYSCSNGKAQVAFNWGRHYTY